MASTMRQMMNDFYTLREMFLDEAGLHLEEKDFIRLEMCDQLISYANNCHQKTPSETVNYITQCWEQFREKNENLDTVAEELINETIDSYR